MSLQAGILAVRACRKRSGTILYDRSRAGYFKRLLRKFLLLRKEDSEFLVSEDSFGGQVESIDLRPSGIFG